MRALLVSPDYASHYLPISAVGHELRARGLDVVVATGSTLESRVRADGFEHRLLPLGPGSNSGLSDPGDQDPDEARRLQAFFEATRQGPIATLRHQAEQRQQDLLWQPDTVTERLALILEDVRPDLVVSDQLAYGASLALRALDCPYTSLHPGHPTALPGPGEVFGVPPYFPSTLDIDAHELVGLRNLCVRVQQRFAEQFRLALHRLNPRVQAPANPFAVGGSLATLINYPGTVTRRASPPGATWLGACVRPEQLDPELHAELESLPRPRVYASLGSFLSMRGDVLARIAAAFGDTGTSLVLASGVTEPASLGPIGPRMLVRPYLPQVAVLPRCDLVICHGGNNTVTEALYAGVPLLAGPFSTDQFAGAEDLRRSGLGDAFDPNRADPAEITARVGDLLRSTAVDRASVVGRWLRAVPGRRVAADRLLSNMGGAAAA
jgi:zeaxanthin glucosyltransferase